MAQVAAGIERRLMAHIAKKYPQPIHKLMHNPLEIPTAAMQQRRKEEKRLFPVLSQLPHWGIGRIVTTSESADNPIPTFWRITRVHVDFEPMNFEFGVAWGVLTQQGRSKGYEEEISDANEHLWRLIPRYEESYYLNYKPDSKPFKEVPMYVPLPPLLSRMQKAQKAKEGSEDADKDCLVRLLIHRGPSNTARQRMPDGSLV